MERTVVAVSVAVLLVTALALPGQCMNMCQPPPPPQCGYITKMVPCVKTQMVPQLVPCTAVVPERKIGYRCQKVLVRGCPVGPPQGMDPCTKCCPQPFCHVVTQQVPFTYCVPRKVCYYNVVYKPVCRTVWLPQTYKVQAMPLCN
jgi:hypothetical protein